MADAEPTLTPPTTRPLPARGWHLRSLMSQYIASFVAVVGLPLVGYTGVTVWFAAEEHRAALEQIQRANADAAALRITLNRPGF